MGKPHIQTLLRASLTDKTFAHCLAVAAKADELGPSFGVAPPQARLAGWLHDCAKNVPLDQVVSAAEQAGIEVFEEERQCPGVLHQRLGAHLAAHRLGVSDQSVLAAIECHTTGRADMDELARCLFVADYVSADRSFTGVDDLRQSLEAGPEAAFVAVLRFKLEQARSRGYPLHRWAEGACLQWLGSYHQPDWRATES